MTSREGRAVPKTLWAYSYQILPPQSPGRLRAVQALLDHEHGDAGRDARTWTGRIVLDPLMTHILVVSDGPAQDREVNRQLEAAFAGLKAAFALTAPMPVVDVLPV